jgi:hypothetical protein
MRNSNSIVYSISTFACFYSVKGEHIWTIIKFPFWAPVKVILWAAWTAFYLLPERVQTAIPYYARYVKKWAFHKKPSSGVKLHVLPSRLATRRRGLDEYAARLARILRKEKTSNYDILQLIAQEVDYVDLINLSLVSKAIRSTMFPSGEDDEDERQLRLNSCAGKIKSTCWVCAIQICQVRLPSTTSSCNALTRQPGLQCSATLQRVDRVATHAALPGQVH